jgi:hypothetical protein
MTLRELTHKQLLALVGLMESVATLDGTVSEGEEQRISRVAEELGDEAFRDLADEVSETFDDRDALKAFLLEVTDKDARELIYGMVMDEVMAEPTINAAPSDLLEWLAEAWDVSVNVGDGAKEQEAPPQP